MVMTRDSIGEFERLLRSVEGMYRRRDSGTLTGRNSMASDYTLSARMRDLTDLYRRACGDPTDPLPEHLDANARLAERWRKVQRRWAGLRP